MAHRLLRPHSSPAAGTGTPISPPFTPYCPGRRLPTSPTEWHGGESTAGQLGIARDAITHNEYTDTAHPRGAKSRTKKSVRLQTDLILRTTCDRLDRLPSDRLQPQHEKIKQRRHQALAGSAARDRSRSLPVTTAFYRSLAHRCHCRPPLRDAQDRARPGQPEEAPPRVVLVVTSIDVPARERRVDGRAWQPCVESAVGLGSRATRRRQVADSAERCQCCGIDHSPIARASLRWGSRTWSQHTQRRLAERSRPYIPPRSARPECAPRRRPSTECRAPRPAVEGRRGPVAPMLRDGPGRRRKFAPCARFRA